ncbi:MAG TPA: tail fiber domain-containing protein, partial [Clostridia bacterium]|nr:tail fiber domain-containing protein [Clostridia bacterium]
VWLANDTDGLRCFSFGQNTLASIQTTPGSAVGIGGPPVDSMLDVEGDMHLNDHDLFLRAGNDRNHGLGWYGSEKLFSGMDPDGPVLYGYGGGMLGTTALGQRIALMWRANGTINLNPKDYFQGTLYVDGFLRGGLQFGSNRWSGIAAPRNTGCLDFYSDTTKKLRLTPGGCLTIDPDGYNSGTSSEYSLSFGDGKEGIFSKRTSGGNQFGLDFATRGIRRFAISSAGAVIVDPDDANDGSLTPGLIFGFGSGEGIASRRKTGSGLNGLEFYTGFKSRFFIDNGGNVGIGTLSPSSLLDIEGDARLNNHDLFLRDGTDTWHGLGFYGGSAKTFASQNINGPVLYGNSGGALGTIDAKGQKIALRWDNNSRVTAIGQLSCDDIIRLNDHEIKLRGGSDGNHALGWYGGTSPFAGQTSPDGPVLYGYTGGMLGSSANGSQWTLKWHHNGNVEVRGTLYDACDRSIKEDFAPVDCTQVLEKVSALPMQTWRYKSEEHGIQHLGPVAQDFHAAFGLGKDDKHIATVDADGVALAAIQGLNQKLETTLKQKDAEIQALKDTVAELKQIVSHLAAESAQKAY